MSKRLKSRVTVRQLARLHFLLSQYKRELLCRKLDQDNDGYGAILAADRVLHQISLDAQWEPEERYRCG